MIATKGWPRMVESRSEPLSDVVTIKALADALEIEIRFDGDPVSRLTLNIEAADKLIKQLMAARESALLMAKGNGVDHSSEQT